MGRRLLALSLILLVKSIGVITQQEVCSISGVSTETKQVSFGGQTQFQCDLGGNGRLWWQSRDCNPGSFVRSDRTDCRDGDLMCVVPVEVYQDGYFYFCCTPMDARSVAEASPLQCFQVQVCTEVNEEEYPTNVLPGTVGVIRINVAGHPQPNGSLTQPAEKNIIRKESIPNTYTNFSFVISFVVPDVQQPELDFEIRFTTPPGCQDVASIGYAIVIQNPGELLEGLDVCSAAPTTPMPTPSPSNPFEECDCFIAHSWIAAAIAVGLVIVTVILTLIVTYCICELRSYRVSLSSSQGTSTNMESYNGPYPTGPYEVTQIATLTNGGQIHGQPPVYSTIPDYIVQTGQPQGEVITARPSQLRLLSTERTPEETPATSETLLYPQQQQYSFTNGLPADGSAIPHLQRQPAGTDV